MWLCLLLFPFSLSTQIKLSKAYSKLDGIHPSDLADILEDLDHASRVALFNSLDEERAASVSRMLFRALCRRVCVGRSSV